MNLDSNDVQDLRLAALLHDIGHYPYSHLMEYVDNVVLTEEFVTGDGAVLGGDAYPRHEELGREIITRQTDLVEAIGGAARAERVAELISSRPADRLEISKLLHSSLDMDRLDYLVRDSRAAGVPYGAVDINYILKNVRVSQSGMVGIDVKAIPAAEQFLLARYFMHRTVYYHKTTLGLEEVVRHLLRRCRSAGKWGVPRSRAEILAMVRNPTLLLEFTDHFVDKVIHEALCDPEPMIKLLAEAAAHRKPPVLLREVCAIVDTTSDGAVAHNACSTFKQACKHEMRNLAQGANIPLEAFLFAEPRSLGVEERGGVISASHGSVSNSEEELIRVFLPNEAEPVPLPNVSWSIMNQLGRYHFQMCRLYVLRQVVKEPNVLDNLRREVSTW